MTHAHLHSLSEARRRKLSRIEEMAKAKRQLRIEQEAYARRETWLASLDAQVDCDYEPIGEGVEPLDLCPEPDIRDELTALDDFEMYRDEHPGGHSL